MLTTYDEFIPLISQLNHSDKLRLAQWLINTIATEEGITPTKATENKNQSGLCGIWQDSRNDKIISDEIINSRTMGREIAL
jgi:hypothetical protein